MITRAMAALRERRTRRTRARRSMLLSGGPAPDPRIPQQSLDPNARFIGEQMGSGEGG